MPLSWNETRDRATAFAHEWQHTKETRAALAAAAAMPSIPKELIDPFVTGPMSAEAVSAASMAFKEALIERALGAELSHHLGYWPGATKPEDAVNHRNGVSGKTVLTEDGPLRFLAVVRESESCFATCSSESPLTGCLRRALHKKKPLVRAAAAEASGSWVPGTRPGSHTAWSRISSPNGLTFGAAGPAVAMTRLSPLPTTASPSRATPYGRPRRQ